MPLPTTNETKSERSFLRDRAYQQLFEAIQTGQLLPGETLRDGELMSWLGMSRTPIRHALIRLAEYGLIEMSAGRQTRVAELAPDRTNRALAVSGVFNEYAVRRMVGRLSDDQLTALETARARLHEAVAAEDPAWIAREVAAVFALYARATGNRVLNAQIDRTDAELARFLQPTEASVDVEYMIIGIDRLIDAVLAGDRDRAVSACRALYEPTRSNFIERFRDPEIV